MSAHRPMTLTFQRAAWLFLGYTLLVVLWGAFVRATGSGAGCGDHWPLCNGEMLPREASSKTLVELTHRVTSGLCWFGALGLAVWAFRGSDRGHPVRSPALLSVVLMTTEALIGAGVVLFEMVADNASIARGYWMGAHLINTFLLVASLALMARQATAPFDFGGVLGRLRTPLGGLFAGTIALFLLVGVSGAVAALGDTLFPSDTLEEALAADLSPTAHVFIRLRVFHPLLALAGSAAILAACGYSWSAVPRGRSLAAGVALLALAQVGLGFLNVLLLAPVWLQLVHLLLADLLWIGLWLLAVTVLQPSSQASAAVSPDGARVGVQPT